MSSNPHRVILFANGELYSQNYVLQILKKGDYLVAVDGGLHHMTDMMLTPNLIIGDLDSADPETVNHFTNLGVEVRKFPCDKNETDLELALTAALEKDPVSILIVAALGGRLDQSLANLFLLTRSDLTGREIRLVDGKQEVLLIQGEAIITGQVSQRVSLLPFCSPAKGIQTSGLKFPLQDETLYPDRTRGVSNQMDASSAKINCREGILLCIHETIDPTSTVVRKGE